MKIYFQVFVNYKQNNWAKLLLIVKFAYNNLKNAITNHIFFELNCGFHLQVSYKEDIILNLSQKLQTS